MRRLAKLVLPFALIQSGCAQDKPDGEGDFNPRQVVPAIRAITDAKISKPAELEHAVGAGDLVLGVEIKGEARAYPINMLTGPKREIINDKLGDRSIAATW